MNTRTTYRRRLRVSSYVLTHLTFAWAAQALQVAHAQTQIAPVGNSEPLAILADSSTYKTKNVVQPSAATSRPLQVLDLGPYIEQLNDMKDCSTDWWYDSEKGNLHLKGAVLQASSLGHESKGEVTFFEANGRFKGLPFTRLGLYASRGAGDRTRWIWFDFSVSVEHLRHALEREWGDGFFTRGELDGPDPDPRAIVYLGRLNPEKSRSLQIGQSSPRASSSWMNCSFVTKE